MPRFRQAIPIALENLRRRELIWTTSDPATAVPEHDVLRHWRTTLAARKLSTHEKRKDRAGYRR
jgi:hypothetical protein